MVFDMDGVLVDTREANRQAYLRCGVVPPDDHHVRPWQTWCSPEQHDAKAEYFPDCLREYGRELPHLDLALSQSRDLPVVVLTNASTRSLEACRAAFPRLCLLPAVWDMRPEMKLAWLQSCRMGGTYYDDSVAMVCRVREVCPGWTAILVPSP